MPEPFLPCAECRGYGFAYASGDPSAARIVCEPCHGTGNAQCENCRNDCATEIWFEDGREYALCDYCFAAWAREAAA